MITASNVVLALLVAAVVGAAIRWVSRWKFSVPTILTCEVKSIQEEEAQYVLQLQVEKVDFTPPRDIFERLARPSIVRRAPKAGRLHTFRVPQEKMRAVLRPGDHVVIEGRVLKPVLPGGVEDLSIHRAHPAE